MILYNNILDTYTSLIYYLGVDLQMFSIRLLLWRNGYDIEIIESKLSSLTCPAMKHKQLIIKSVDHASSGFLNFVMNSSQK